MGHTIIYVGVSVTNCTPEYRQFVVRAKEGLRMARNVLVLEWVGKDIHVNIGDFFATDMNNVRRCDVMIAFVDEPSIGLGMEIHAAIDSGKPLLCLYREGNAISRLLLGAGESIGLAVRPYRDLADAISIATEFVEETRAKLNGHGEAATAR